MAEAGLGAGRGRDARACLLGGAGAARAASWQDRHAPAAPIGWARPHQGQVPAGWDRRKPRQAPHSPPDSQVRSPQPVQAPVIWRVRTAGGGPPGAGVPGPASSGPGRPGLCSWQDCHALALGSSAGPARTKKKGRQ